MAKLNASLNVSKQQKQDEFYTQLSDVENELKYFKDSFKGKVVFCNCDDPYESNFFKYFAMNFNFLGLKKLIATCYNGSPVAGTQLDLSAFCGDTANNRDRTTKRCAHKIVITEVKDENGDGAIDLSDVEYLIKNKKNVLTVLKGNGDFRSDECIELLKECDIVVTNPPFSLFREYLAQLVEYNKKFIIVGNQNAVTYKEVFPLIIANKVWLGHHSGHTWFSVAEDYDIPENYKTVDKKKARSNGYYVDENGKIWRNLGNICWFTNIDYTKRHEPLTLYKTYNEKEYPKYDNFDAIEVGKVVEIPMDYNGLMGVPVTFLDKYCPEQFELIGNEESLNIPKGRGYVNGKRLYGRIFIKRIGEN